MNRFVFSDTDAWSIGDIMTVPFDFGSPGTSP